MKNTGQRKPCQLHEQWVSFEDFGWDWVIAAASTSPEGDIGFYMNFCAGYCPHPMSEHMNATNHAIFQQLYNRMGNDVDPPCCIPIEYEAIDILTTNLGEIADFQLKQSNNDGDRDFSKAESVELRKFEEMSAVSCGCH